MSLATSLVRHPVRSGMLLLVALGAVVLLIFSKPSLVTWLTPGETLSVEFARDYKLRPNLSAVKIAGAKIGVVQSVGARDDGPGAVVTLKVDHGTRALLGTEPNAVVMPTTLLGGSYFVQLTPGGSPGRAPELIPQARTGLPVELQQILSAVPPEAQRGSQLALTRFDDTFRAGVGNALNTLLADAPSGLRPTGKVVDALRGVNKDADLANLVTDLNTTARTLSATPGELRSLVDSTAATARAFGDNAAAVDRTIATLPVTLRTTRDGAGKLGELLDRLTETADDARPIVRELDPMLDELEPALDELRPVLEDLEPLLRDADPLLEKLAPGLDTTTDVLDDVDGPALDRLNGPILDALLSEWKGFAPKYPQGGATGTKMYEELTYLITNAGGALQPFNAGQHFLAVYLGVGPTMVQGTGPLVQSVQDYLSEMYGPPHQKQPLPLGPKLDSIPLPLPLQDKPGPKIPAPDTGAKDLLKGVGK